VSFFPLIGLTILSVLGVMVASLLVIPGLILYNRLVCRGSGLHGGGGLGRLSPWNEVLNSPKDIAGRCSYRSAENVGSAIVGKIIEVSFNAIGGGTWH